MPLHLEIERLLSARSKRVKCVDIHPTEPWMLVSLYDPGDVHIWNYQTQELVKTFEVTELPVRSGKFIARKQWIVAASDDMMVRVYNYNTLEKVKSFDAHLDYIRSIAVHPSLPLVLTTSDDMTIKMWNWDKSWACERVFEGHNHYVMAVKFNPKDANTFASASLDRTIKVWNISSIQANFTLEGHAKGVNCLDYFVGGEKPYLLSGGDDGLVNVWDYQNKTCVQTLEVHTHNVSDVCFHPELPLIASASEDGSVQLWHSSTYRLENTLEYNMERAWSLCAIPGKKMIAVGYDEGSVLIRLGRDMPAVSMDPSGKIICARHNEIQLLNLKQAEGDIRDGDRIMVPPRDLGSCEIYPRILEHNPNGRFVCVCGDGEYIIYTALAWRNRAYGKGLDFCWSSDSGEYAVRTSTSTIELHKNFKKRHKYQTKGAVGIYGGPVLCVQHSNCIVFVDWEEAKVVRRIDVDAKQVFWSDDGGLVCIVCDESFYILHYNPDETRAYFESGNLSDAGCEESLVLVHQVAEVLQSGKWVGDVLIYSNARGRLNYSVGKEVFTLAHLDREMYILGYLPKANRIYLIDRQFNIVSYSVMISVLEYQTFVIRGDLDSAARVLPTIPEEHLDRIARFLESMDLKDLALEVAKDPEQRFDLAVQLGHLDVAHQIAKEANSEAKWKQLAELATNQCMFDLAAECHLAAHDWGALLLLYSSLGNREGMERVAKLASDEGINNIGFLCHFLTGHHKECLDLLCATGRVPEAAFLARTYMPSEISRIVKLWREELGQLHTKAAQSLADPSDYENLFPDLKVALQAEKTLATKLANPPLASEYPNLPPQPTLEEFLEEIRQDNVQLIDVGEDIPSDEPDQIPDEDEVVTQTETEIEIEEVEGDAKVPESYEPEKSLLD